MYYYNNNTYYNIYFVCFIFVVAQDYENINYENFPIYGIALYIRTLVTGEKQAVVRILTVFTSRLLEI